MKQEQESITVIGKEVKGTIKGEEKKSDVKNEERKYPVKPYQYKKVLKEGTDGPMAEVGSKVAIAWRLKKDGVQEVIEKSTAKGEQFRLNDPDAWPYQMIGQI